MKHKYLAKRYWKDTATPLSVFSELAAKYDDIINLSLGDHDLITDEKIIMGAFKDAMSGHTKYTQALGDSELREEIKKFYKSKYNHEVKTSEIMALAGGCHAMYLALEAILDEGDEVIVHEPYFTPYIQQVKLAGGIPIILKTFEKDGFQVDADNLKLLINERTKAIIINSPNNPTGACFSKETLEKIARIGVEHDLFVISDEVYDAFCYHGEFIPIASIEGMKERTLTIGSFSKGYAMTGWRIGYAIGPEYLIDTMKEINEGICFTASSVSQRAALHALREGEGIQREIKEEYEKRVFYAYERVNKIKKLSVIKPTGGIYLFVNIKNTEMSSFDFSIKLLEEAHVLVIPGTAFGESGEGYVRIACTVDTKLLEEAFNRIEKMNI